MPLKINIAIGKICAVLLLFVTNSAFFQVQLLSQQNDTLKNVIPDSVGSGVETGLRPVSTEPDSTKDKDTVQLNSPLQQHGSMKLLSNYNYININKKDLEFKEYNGFFEALKNFVPANPLSLGNPGMFNSFSFFGSSTARMAVTFNGNPLFDPEYSSINLEQLGTEFFENIELLVGSDAVVLSDNSAGALINIQEIKYDTKKPYTKLWYAQGGEGFISADGIFSQNIAPNLNYAFGFRRQSGNGKENQNSWMDTWNVRNLLRWNPFGLTSISLIEYFTNHGMGLSGGIDRANSPDNNIFDRNAIPYYIDFKQRVFRHDLSLNCSSLLTEDSTTAVSLDLFLSNSSWEMQLQTIHLSDTADTSIEQKHLSRYYGFNAKFEQKLFNTFLFRAGTDAYFVELENSIYNDALKATSISVFAQSELDLFSFLKLSAGLRLRNYNNATMLSGGFRTSFNITDKNKIMLDISLSERPPSASEGLNLKNETHYLQLLNYTYNDDDLQFSGGAFYRMIANPIMYYLFDTSYYSANQSDKEIWGINLSVHKKIFKLITLDGTFYLNRSLQVNNSELPPYYGTISGYYEIESGRSILRLGAAVSMVSSFKGLRYLPQYRSYTENDIESGFMTDGIKVFALAKLGNTYVKLSFENILSLTSSLGNKTPRGYYLVPDYPFYDFNFRFSFIWSFLD